MKVLVACEYSGIVRNEFTKKGHDAWSCDILPTEIEGNHYQCDIFEVLNQNWDLIIAHPPCTYLCNSGVRWLHTREGRWQQMEEGANFFKKLWNANCDKICVENPIPHKYALEIIGQKYTQIIQPWQFGHGETKATCLWLKNLPKLEPTEIVSGREQKIWNVPPSENRGKIRSKTYQGIAQAMAKQWV
jgi:hypothetical protein